MILDKDHVAQTILPQSIKVAQELTLSEDMFLQSVNMFWRVMSLIGSIICKVSFTSHYYKLEMANSFLFCHN